ncbi:thioredoxin-like protein, partial [Neocallimastix californiae]
EEEEIKKPVERQRMDPEIERILEDQQLRQSLSHQGGAATGPKGVIADYKFHQKQNALRREQHERKVQTNINKGAMSSGWIQQDDDEFMIQYRQKRLMELKRIAGRTRFGQLMQIGVDQYVDAIDKEDSRTAVIMHLFQPHNEQCKLMNQYLMILAEKYRLAKFLCIISTEADPNFDEIALPTLLCYRNKELVANLVRVTDELTLMDNGMFDIEDLEKLLLKKKALIKEDILD